MKASYIFRLAAIFLVAIVALFLGHMGWGAFAIVTPEHGLLVTASEGALVRVHSVERGTVEFLAGTGGVTFYARPLLPAASALFTVLVIFALKGAASMFHDHKPKGQTA